jgi:hypothetical protein
MTLATFPLIIRRWKRSELYHIDYSQYAQLAEYVRTGPALFFFCLYINLVCKT